MGILAVLPAAVTTLFLAAIISYYALLLIGRRRASACAPISSLTVIIPAHNEEEHIAEAIGSALAADFSGKKRIIVVDDGSTDRTAEIASGFLGKGVTLIRTPHRGKSSAINTALSQAAGEAIAIVDGDSRIRSDALQALALELGTEKVGAACGIVAVRNRRKMVCMWIHIEQLYNSLIRDILSRINANIVTPGPLSMYRKEALERIGGFGTHGLSEDVDVTIRLIRAGYHVNFSERALSETHMPYQAKEFLRQRFRFARGLTTIIKRHLRLNTMVIDLYTLPLFLFSYVQAVVMGIFTLYQILSGYLAYFASEGTYLSWAVGKFFFEWLSIFGFIRWLLSVLSGATPLDLIAAVGIASTLLTYPLYLYAILKYDRKLDIWHIIPLLFMFPFWLLIMVIYILSLPEYLKKEQPNIWKKNE